MKKRWISFLMALVLCAGLLPLFSSVAGAAENDGVLYDEADVLSPAEEAALENRLLTLSQTYQVQIVVYTIPSLPYGSIDSYVHEVYDGMGFGYGENRDGVLLLLCTDPRELRILSNGMAADAISVSDIDDIFSLMLYDLGEDNYADAFELFADQCEFYLDGYINGYPFPTGFALLICFGIGFVIALISVMVMKAQLKSVRQQREADNYIKSGSMQVTLRKDLFLYRDLKRVKKESSGSSGSGSRGSSRNVGGGSF